MRRCTVTGVRMGSFDIYRALEAMLEVAQWLVIGVGLPGGYWFPSALAWIHR